MISVVITAEVTSKSGRLSFAGRIGFTIFHANAGNLLQEEKYIGLRIFREEDRAYA